MAKSESHIVNDGMIGTNHTLQSVIFDNFNHSNMYKRSRVGLPLHIISNDLYASNMETIGTKHSKIETFSWTTVPRGWDVFRLLPPPPDNLNRGKYENY
ncbi:hypothetical protein LOAG_14307 [Loa loa]|uniref:Uncharacterized protein n=1 Tax=Loa loa TaxID=7209 RepID=A0A1I7W2A7_LOALO|nr:hypothetical protein LOAG_14307 [Loa loa]EFO14217.2 hypothetical protein LOAG_14307 [Loa loa]